MGRGGDEEEGRCGEKISKVDKGRIEQEWEIFVKQGFISLVCMFFSCKINNTADDNNNGKNPVCFHLFYIM